MDKFTDKVLSFVFRGYAKRLQTNSRLEKDLYEATFDVKDLVRGKLKGLRPGHPDDDFLSDKLESMDEPERLDFLLKAQEVVKNGTFQEVLKYLIIESEHKAMLYSVDMTEVNFNRATINGLMLISEELERLGSMYKEQQEAVKNKMSEEDKHSAI